VTGLYRGGERPCGRGLVAGSVSLVRIAIVSGGRSPTDGELAAVRARGLEVVQLTLGEAVASLAPTDVALGRLDVRPELDGVEDGLWSLGVLAARGITVLNVPDDGSGTHGSRCTG